MRVSRLIAAAAVAAFALPSSALGQIAFDKQIRHWRVVGMGGICFAVNRPSSERDTPFNSLHLSRSFQGRWELTVFFWPGAFKERAEVELTFELGPAGSIKQRAPASGDFLVRFDLTAEARGTLAKAGKSPARIVAAGLRAPLVFDLSDLGAVLAALEECAKTQR